MDHRLAPAPIRRTAVNSAAESVNKIHDEEEARRYGYGGALVPGVTLYAYLTQVALPFFGPEWQARGGSTLRLLRPVYEGQELDCTATVRSGDHGDTLDLVCARDGTVCADGTAWLFPPSLPVGDLPPLPPIERAQPLPELTPETAPIGVPLAPFETPITVSDAAAYADETADPSPWFRGPSPFGPAILPSGWLAARQARLLRHNFHIGPSIHAASEIRHLAPAPAGAIYRTGGVIVETYERKGNHYLVLDALTTADGTPVARVRHTSIFQVRRV
jgi:acyl dehydratase